MDIEQQQSQLKLLIAKGKEQGYLTYHEVNDHLPEGIVDPEQIEDIISMINDMGISVHEVAPDVDALMLLENAVEPDDDDAEEAAAALANLDSEFGRTTDPVRMYMREMGSVDLLTRQGEIKIAKRIEEGLAQSLAALSSHPLTVAEFLNEYEKVANGELKLHDVIIGFAIPDEEEEEETKAETEVEEIDDSDKEDTNDDTLEEDLEGGDDIEVDDEGEDSEDAVQGKDDEDDDDEEEETATEESGESTEVDEEEVVDSGPDPEEVRQHCESILDLHRKLCKTTVRYGSSSSSSIKYREEISEQFLDLKLSPKLVERLAGKLRSVVSQIRNHERSIIGMCVAGAKMPRNDFIAAFPGSEADPSWAEKYADKPYAQALEEYKPEIERIQNRLAGLEKECMLTIGEIKDINRRMSIGEAKALRAKKRNG